MDPGVQMGTDRVPVNGTGGSDRRGDRSGDMVGSVEEERRKFWMRSL